MQIYITTNKINGKKYIGKEKYSNPNYLGSGKHIQRAIKKYGKDNFTKEILEECTDEKDMNEREKYWINYYNATNSKEFYNLAEGGEGGNTIAGYTKQQKKEWAKKAFGGVTRCYNKGKSILESYKNDIINLYTKKDYSLKEIATKYKCYAGTVKRFLVNNGIKIDLHKGLNRGRKTLIQNSISNKLGNKIITDFKSGMTIPEIDKKYNISSAGRVLSLHGLKRYPNRHPETHRPISIKNKDGVIKHFKSLKECGIFIGSSIGEVSCLANNHKFQLRGWTTLDRDHTKIKIPDRLIVDPYGKIWNIAIEAKDIKTFCKKHNLKVGGISRVLNKKTLQHKGWHLSNTQITLKNQLKKIIKDNIVIEFVSFTQLVNDIKYKQCNFRKDSLCNLFKGIITNHRGWTVLKD
jgi:predicted DNA-binding protein YlxM (UPF0122 family)